MRTIFALAAAAALWGCHGSDVAQKPRIQPDRTELGFGSEYGDAVFVGTRPQETLQLKNGGQDDLAVASVAVQGANGAVFTAVLDKQRVKSGETAFVAVTYAPTASGSHSAQLVIASNAENSPSLTIGLKGSAVTR